MTVKLFSSVLVLTNPIKVKETQFQTKKNKEYEIN